MKLVQKELDMILHWILTLVGGFLGTYAILLHAGNFGSAQTGNVMEMAAALTEHDFVDLGIRVLAFIIFGSAIVISYLLTNYTGINMRRLVLWVDAAGLALSAVLTGRTSAVVSLYPVFFCSAFQWGSYSGASGYNSASIFTTNNYKQTLLAWTQYFITKDAQFLRKGIMYTFTVLAFFIGACIGSVSVYAFGAYGAFIGFIPLIVARLMLILEACEAVKAEKAVKTDAATKSATDKASVSDTSRGRFAGSDNMSSAENGTPQETIDEAIEELKEAEAIENSDKFEKKL